MAVQFHYIYGQILLHLWLVDFKLLFGSFSKFFAANFVFIQLLLFFALELIFDLRKLNLNLFHRR